MQLELIEQVGAVAERSKKTRYLFSDWSEELIDGPQAFGLFDVDRQDVTRYFSGGSAKWDLLGYARAGLPVGVTATELSDEVVGRVCDLARDGVEFFVDSGAFGAFRAGRELDFEGEVFPFYDRLVDGGGAANLLLVAPDVIGDGRATIELQSRHRATILRWMDVGARVMFPAQARGADALVWFKEVVALTDGRPFVVGVPSNACAWSPREVVAFCEAARPAQIHLLGLGKSESVRALAQMVAEVSSVTRVSCDSCQLLAHVGEGRRLTDRCRTRLDAAINELVELAMQGESPDGLIPSCSEFAAELLDTPGLISVREARAIGLALGVSAESDLALLEASAGVGLCYGLSQIDPDGEWAEFGLAQAAVDAGVYGAHLRKLLSGPVRAYEVARLGLGRPIELHRLGRWGSRMCA